MVEAIQVSIDEWMWYKENVNEENWNINQP